MSVLWISGVLICWSRRGSMRIGQTSFGWRSDIRHQLETNNEAISQSVTRRTLVLGTEVFSRSRLEALRAAGAVVHIRVLGLASVDSDVSPELALATIASVEV